RIEGDLGGRKRCPMFASRSGRARSRIKRPGPPTTIAGPKLADRGESGQAVGGSNLLATQPLGRCLHLSGQVTQGDSQTTCQDSASFTAATQTTATIRLTSPRIL